MPTELRRLVTPLPTREVAAVLTGTRRPPTEPTGATADLDPFIGSVHGRLDTTRTLTARTDADLAERLHTLLHRLPRRTLLDAGFWHWLCLEPLRDYVLARWCGGVDPDAAPGLGESQLSHFVGAGSLVGFARNAAARLFWGADASYACHGDYRDIDVVFANTDLFTGVFERKLGLRPEAVTVIMRRLRDEREDVRRQVLKRLNFVLTTTALEALDGHQLEAQVEELIALGD